MWIHNVTKRECRHFENVVSMFLSINFIFRILIIYIFLQEPKDEYMFMNILIGVFRFSTLHTLLRNIVIRTVGEIRMNSYMNKADGYICKNSWSFTVTLTWAYLCMSIEYDHGCNVNVSSSNESSWSLLEQNSQVRVKAVVVLRLKLWLSHHYGTLWWTYVQYIR